MVRQLDVAMKCVDICVTVNCPEVDYLMFVPPFNDKFINMNNKT